MASFYAKPNRVSWSLYEEKWVDQKRVQVKVPTLAYQKIGIDPTLSLEDARKRIKVINKEKKLDRHQAAQAARRVSLVGFHDAIFFPEDLLKEFTERVRERSAGADAHKSKLQSHFKFIQEMILELKVLPKDYAEDAHKFYQYMIQKQCSVDYSKKLIQMLNMWGQFVAKTQGTFFQPAPTPPRKFRGTIAKAQRSKIGVRKESERLTLTMLTKMKSKLPIEQYNWLFVSLWLGLRPIETDQLSGVKLDIQKNDAGILVLAVNQTKIETEDESESIKYIPILFEQQQTAISILKSGEIERPTPTMLKKVSGEKIDTYCARKGFVDLMQSLGQQIDHASIWMGHKDIKTTLKHYKNPLNVPFTLAKKETPTG